ncbi:hypothetical protein Tco_0400823 [Tanacetum coccineum]
MPSFPSSKPTVSYFNDLDFFKDFENEFPAIVYKDALTSKLDFLTEPTVSPQHIDEFNLRDETSLSKCDEEEQNILYFNDLFPFNVIYPDDSKSDKDNDDDKIDIKHSSGGNVINTDDGAYAQSSSLALLELLSCVISASAFFELLITNSISLTLLLFFCAYLWLVPLFMSSLMLQSVSFHLPFPKSSTKQSFFPFSYLSSLLASACNLSGNNLSASIIACTLSHEMLASSAFSLASIGVSVGLVVDSPGSLKVMLLALGIVEGVVVVVLCTGSCTTTLGFTLLNSANA